MDKTAKARAYTRKWQQEHREKMSEYQKRYRKRNRDKELARLAQWRKEHHDKYRAHYMVYNALKDGRLKRKPCEVCGDKAEAHHEDYKNPFDINWLCFKHHRQRHNEVKHDA